MRFLPFFPYGFCSQHATAIAGKANPYAGLHLLGDNPDKVLAQNEQYRQRTLYKARDLCNKGYTKDIKRACGTPSKPRSFRALTQTGLAVLAEFPDYEESLKSNHYFSQTCTSAELRDTPYICADSEYESDQQLFNELLSDAVMHARLTPLTSAIGLAGSVKISLDKYSPNQRYSIWYLSLVQAMFRTNDHLTYMDRRPFDTWFAIDGISDEDSYNAYCTKHGTTLPAYTYCTLNTWYQHHPDYHRFAQQFPDASDEAHNAWLTTPAFYSSLELPYNNQDTTVLYTSANGRRQVVNAIHIGLAAGRHVNYVCYHANDSIFKWLPKRERNTKSILTDAIQRMKVQNSKIPYKDTVDFAFYFCTSYHQFLSLFAQTKVKHVKYKKCRPATDQPYSSIHAIPTNDSGTILLGQLLESSPQGVEQAIYNDLVNRDIGFAYNANQFYGLTYKGKRVFCGHTMNVFKINRVLEDHLDGADFWICCFPDQVAWYKHLFPGKKFL